MEDLKSVFISYGIKTPDDILTAFSEAVPYMLPRYLKPWSNTNGRAVISNVSKAEIGGILLLTYFEADERQILLCKTGPHYHRDKDGQAPVTYPDKYTYSGGFVNPEEHEGSSLVQKSNIPESPEAGAAREIEEEIRNLDGSPVLEIDPKRAMTIDHQMVRNLFGEPILLCGMLYNLTSEEVSTLKTHMENLKCKEYREQCMAHTVSPYTCLEEVSDLRFFTMEEILKGDVDFLHAGQEWLVHSLNKLEVIRGLGPQCGYKP